MLSRLAHTTEEMSILIPILPNSLKIYFFSSDNNTDNGRLGILFLVKLIHQNASPKSSVLLYRPEGWTLNQCMKRQLNSFATSCYSIMLAIKRTEWSSNENSQPDTLQTASHSMPMASKASGYHGPSICTLQSKGVKEEVDHTLPT